MQWEVQGLCKNLQVYFICTGEMPKAWSSRVLLLPTAAQWVVLIMGALHRCFGQFPSTGIYNYTNNSMQKVQTLESGKVQSMLVILPNGDVAVFGGYSKHKNPKIYLSV